MLLTVREVSRELNFSEQQIYRWARQGQLSARHFNRALRFEDSEIKKIKAHGINPINYIQNIEAVSRVSIPHKKGLKLWEK
jgi:excisionase family DNA binding protein